VAARPARGDTRLITIDLDPDLIIGAFRISWHSLLSFVGMLVGGFLSIRCARYLVRDERVYPFAIAVVLGGLAGARVAHIIDNGSFYGGDLGRMLDLSRGGIGTMGAPIGSTIAGYVAARALRLPVGFMFDISVIGIALGEAIGRIGDIINGEHHAVPCSGVPWCVGYAHPATLGQPGPVHPIGLYDALLMTAIFVVLYRYWRGVRGVPPESRVYWAYLLLLGAGRYLESFVRDEPLILWGIQEGQLLGLVYAVAGGLMLALLTARSAVRRASVHT